MNTKPNMLRERVFNFAMEKNYEVSKYDEAILELYQNYVQLKHLNRDLNLQNIQQKFLNYVLSIPKEDRFKVLTAGSSAYIWGMKPQRQTSEKILNSILSNQEIYFGEDAFLRCIVGTSQLVDPDQKCFQDSCGFIIDDLTAYFDSTRPSRMEILLNSDLEITPEEKSRARRVMKKLVETKISKYNNQPISKLNIGKNKQKVLVVDQSYKDYSILKGSANDLTFERMLHCAIQENPNADILIKTHPDTIGANSTKPKCYYQNIKEAGNVYKLTENINPFSVIDMVNKVYVCTSQFGFEALIAGKEVHTFGIPFYSNWGLTIDSQTCDRRTRKRSLEDLFFIAYILMSVYINPKTNQPCQIEDAIDYLLEMREHYFRQTEKRCVN